MQIQFSSEIKLPYSMTSVISVLDILTIDILEIWIKKSAF